MNVLILGLFAFIRRIYHTYCSFCCVKAVFRMTAFAISKLQISKKILILFAIISIPFRIFALHFGSYDTISFVIRLKGNRV